MRILITGGAGYLGSRLATALVDHELLLVDCFDAAYDPHQKWLAVAPLVARGVGLAVIDVALSGPLAALSASFRPDAMVHLADSGGDAIGDQMAALVAMASVLGAAREVACRHVIVAVDLPPPAGDLAAAVVNLVEAVATTVAAGGSTAVTVARLAAVIGDGLPPGAPLRRAAAAAMGGREATVAVVHVDDAVAGLIACLEQPPPALRVVDLVSESVVLGQFASSLTGSASDAPALIPQPADLDWVAREPGLVACQAWLAVEAKVLEAKSAATQVSGERPTAGASS